jgi:DNA-directed RNA polymerase specialized sigma24 family protein
MHETMDPVPSTSRPLSQRLADPAMRRLIERFVRRRVPAGEVDDVVQTVLCDALAAEQPPDSDEALRKWLVGITRHKVADLHRANGRARHVELPAELGADEEPHSAREWASWAEKQTEGNPDAERTLDWMAREGGGEKLAHIAEDEKLPATQIRQRVSRLRRMMRERWAAELAAVAAVLFAVLIAWMWLRREQPTADPVLPTPVPETAPPELERAAKLRAEALGECDRNAWERCLEGLDEAAQLDPAGDTSQQVRRARERAEQALEDSKIEESKIDTEDSKEVKAPAEVRPTPSIIPPVKRAPQKPRNLDKEELLQKQQVILPSEIEPDEIPQQQAPPPSEVPKKK